MEEKHEVLENCGEDGATTVFLKKLTDGDAVQVVTDYVYQGKNKVWNFDEIVALLNDGMKYQLLKKAEKYKKELGND